MWAIQGSFASLSMWHVTEEEEVLLSIWTVYRTASTYQCSHLTWRVLWYLATLDIKHCIKRLKLETSDKKAKKTFLGSTILLMNYSFICPYTHLKYFHAKWVQKYGWILITAEVCLQATHRSLWTAGCGILETGFPLERWWCVAVDGPCVTQSASPAKTRNRSAEKERKGRQRDTQLEIQENKRLNTLNKRHRCNTRIAHKPYWLR